MFKEWNLYEKCYLLLGSLLTLVIAYFTRSDFFSLTYSLLCLLNAVFISKGKILGYIFEILATLIYLYLSLQQRYYSEVIISIFLLLPSSLFGLYNWSKHLSATNATILIRDLKKKEIFTIIFSQIILYPVYVLMLKYFNTSLLFISALSISISTLALYFLARGSTLGYCFFIIKDIIGISLWLYPIFLGQSGSMTVLFTFLLYFINDIYGLNNWKRIQQQQQNS